MLQIHTYTRGAQSANLGATRNRKGKRDTEGESEGDEKAHTSGRKEIRDFRRVNGTHHCSLSFCLVLDCLSSNVSTRWCGWPTHWLGFLAILPHFVTLLVTQGAGSEPRDQARTSAEGHSRWTVSWQDDLEVSAAMKDL